MKRNLTMNTKKKKEEEKSANMLFGARLKKIRTLKGVSRPKLAKALGLSLQQVQKYEKGHNGMTVFRIFEISVILNVPIEHFFISVAEQYGQMDKLYISNLYSPEKALAHVDQQDLKAVVSRFIRSLFVEI